jgi:anthranilate synthase component 1
VAGGWVGYFSYDTMRYVEKKKLPFSGAPEDDRGLPDIHLGLYNDVVVFDHVSKVLQWLLKFMFNKDSGPEAVQMLSLLA